MLVVLDTDEAWSLMSVIASYVIDHSGVSQDGKSRIRRWRSDRSVGAAEMDDLTVAVNEALGSYIDEKTARTIRRRGRYVSAQDERGKAR